MFLKNKTDEWPMYIKVSILAIILAILWLFNSQFITPLLLGVMVAILTAPIYYFLLKRLNLKKIKFQIPKSLAAVLTIAGITLTIGLILNRFVFEVVKEAPDFISQISGFVSGLTTDQNFLNIVQQYRIDPEAVNLAVKNLNASLKSLLSLLGKDVNTDNTLLTLEKENIDAALRFGGQSVKNATSYLISTVIFLLAWLNSLVYGKGWINGIFALLPFDQTEETQIRNDLKDGVQNVIYANIVSGGIHALVGFILMLIFGIPNIFILTVIIFLIGFLPFSPSELGYAIPLSLIAIKTGNIFLIIVLSLLSEILILWVNYVLLPSIISSKQVGNDLLILTSILSGISIFGLTGFVIGPVIMILVQTLYSILIKRLEVEKIDAV